MSSSASAAGEASGANGGDAPGRRGGSRSKVLEKKLGKQNTQKLVVEFNEVYGASLPPNGNLFNNYLAQQVRDVMPHRITSWEQVSEEDIQLLYDHLQLKFIFPSDDVVDGEIVRLAQRAVVQRRNNMKVHWKLKGGLIDRNAARGLPYEGVSEEDWNFLCDHFESEDQMKLMEKNVSNRSKRPLESVYGSKTIIQHFHEKVDPLTGELPSAVDHFEEFYCKGGKWKNDYAEMAHKKMLEERKKPQPIDEPEENMRVPKEIHITAKVLGKRSRYVKGVGPLPKLSLVGGSRATGISSKCSNQEVIELRQTVDELQNKLKEHEQKMQQQMKEQQEQFQQQMSLMMQQIQQQLQQPTPAWSSAPQPP